jgi:hypothetical protein
MMKSKRLSVVFALSFLAMSSAYAGRDEALIQQTRKNQLAHDAKMKKEQQEKQQKEAAAAANANTPAPAPDSAGTGQAAPAKQ